MDGSLQLLLTAAEVARVLGVSKITIYRLVKADQLAVVRIGNKLRFESEAVQKYVNQDCASDSLNKMIEG